MRIVDRTTFLALPAGTVYAKWGDGSGDPSHMYNGPIEVKGDSLSNDWYAIDLFGWPEDVGDSGAFFDVMELARKGQPTAPMEFAESRDALFEDRQYFAVFERVEVERLIDLFTDSLRTAYTA